MLQAMAVMKIQLLGYPHYFILMLHSFIN